MRTATVNSCGSVGLTESLTVPSHGYWVSCDTVTARLPNFTFPLPAAYKLT